MTYDIVFCLFVSIFQGGGVRVGLRPGQEFFFVLQTSKEFWVFSVPSIIFADPLGKKCF